MSPRQRSIAQLAVATEGVRERLKSHPSSHRYWREHLRRNERKLRWLRYLESR